MAAADAHTDFKSWSVDGRGPRIEYAVPILEEICAAAVEGLYRFRHGGVEIGGVLFGEADDGLVRILAYRPLECEHAFGPRFVLSDRDRTALKELLYAGRDDAECRELEPVGWYHSHTRSPIELSPRDLEIYDSYFPQHWQIALVIRPDSYGPAGAGFFFRERNNTVRTEAAYEEFVVSARRHASSRAEAGESAPEPVTARAHSSPAEVAFVPGIVVPETPAPYPEPVEAANAVEPPSTEPVGEEEFVEPEPVETAIEPAVAAAIEPAESEPEAEITSPVCAGHEVTAPTALSRSPIGKPLLNRDPVLLSRDREGAVEQSGDVVPAQALAGGAETELPSFARGEPGPSRKWLWVALTAAPLLAAAFGVEQYYRLSAPPPPLSLWVADMGGQLLIEWDRTARPIRDAQSATIEISDGTDFTKIPLAGERLREGSVDYVRRSEMVDVRMRVADRGRVAVESISFIGPPVRREPSPEVAALEAQVANLKAQLLEEQRVRARAVRRATPGVPPRQR
jgi:proteasome lid subunit RPN8/RPN11